MYTYDIWQWLFFFYLYCFFGWIFESTYVSVCQRRFVNRGFLRLPMLPLYGSGAIMMLFVSMPVQDNLFLVWLFGALGATALEYVVGISMEAIFKVKYWDYSRQHFNYRGVICLSSSIAWGFLTILMTEVLHKPVEHWVLSMPFWAVVLLDSIISVFFLTDTIVSVKAALDLSHMLDQMGKIRAEFEQLQVQMALGRMEGKDLLDEWRAAFKEQVSDRLSGFIKENREKLDVSRLQERLQEYDLLSGKLDFMKTSLLRDNPSATSRQFNMELAKLKERAETKIAETKDGWRRKLRGSKKSAEDRKNKK
jgi:uncharacterized membrane protein